MEGDWIIMKKYAFDNVRRYCKTFARLAIRYPKDAMNYWFNFSQKIDGVMDMLACDNSMSIHEYRLISKYFKKKMDRLFKIYCK